MNPIRILLVQSGPEDTQFLRDALEEIQEIAAPGKWTTFSVTHVETAEDASVVAASEKNDIILFDPSLPGSSPFAAFAGLNRLVLETPVVVLLNRGNESLAPLFLREGAQDYLLKEEIDCVPLSRAIHNAIQRQRFLNAYRRVDSFDPLTGLHNESGFHLAARRELRMAGSAGQPVLLLLAEIENLADLASACGTGQSDQALIDAAALLRENVGDIALLACLHGSRFAVMLWNGHPEHIISRLQACLSQTARHFAFTFGWARSHPGGGESLETLLDEAQSRLCENGASYQIVSEPLRSMPPTASETVFPG